MASALAKAQGELVNPEKSLVATIRRRWTQGDRTDLSLCALSSGLDIVRKILGQHEIATVQTTSIDQAAGIINLTTVLAHASGEWIASDWPVCAISETATPHRMGASLTYARRYALFTLVGIAGEDDLDAPDLPTSSPATPVGWQGPPGSKADCLKGRGDGCGRPIAFLGEAKEPAALSSSTLSAEPSAQLRDRLLAGIAALATGDEAALWAQRNLREKDKLAVSDAESVERGFAAKLKELELRASEAPESCPGRDNFERGGLRPLDPRVPHAPTAKTRSTRIDKSQLHLPETRRIRDREHVKFVAQQSCLVCGRCPADAHHLRFAQSRALARKVSDEFTVPLCRGHHREVHRSGDEMAWWKGAGNQPDGNGTFALA